jgi:hypothetical protein
MDHAKADVALREIHQATNDLNQALLGAALLGVSVTVTSGVQPCRMGPTNETAWCWVKADAA